MPLISWPEPAWVCLVMLALVMAASCFTSGHPGILAMCLASLLGAYMAFLNGQPIDRAILEVLRAFPVELFITLTVLTFFFAQLSVNGTLGRLVLIAKRVCQGHAGWTILAFFVLASGIGVIGAGNIAAAALIAPLAMWAAQRSQIPPLLMFIAVAHGSMSSALSPVTPTGVTTAACSAIDCKYRDYNSVCLPTIFWLTSASRF